MATDDPDIDPTFYYQVTEVIGGNTTSFPLLVPKDTVGGTLDLADVDRNATIPDPPEIYVRTIDGMYGDVDTSALAPTAATTVVTETAYGQSSVVGTTLHYAREDHSHGTPATPANDTSTQRSIISKAGTTIGTRQQLNLIEGTNVTMTVADNAGSNRVDVTVNAASGGGGTPATAVTAETSYGISSVVGTGTNYARQDHTHGSPSLTANTPAAEAVGSTAVVGTGTAPARDDHRHAMPTSAVTGASAVADTASAGVAATLALSDHRHSREAFASPTAQTTYGLTSTAGSATTLPHSDHTHGTPSLTAVTPTAEAIGSTGAVGTGTAPAREDHQPGMPAAGTPGTLAFAGAAAAGAAATLARSDHAHGMPAAPTAVSVGAVPTTTSTGLNAGLLSARPAAGTALRFYYATDLNTMFEDTGSAWVQLDQSPAITNSWTAIGHSYLQFNAASYNQRSRLDSVLRSRFDAETTNWANLAIAGSRATVEGANQGGWATMIRSINKLPGKTSPYTSSDGGLLICTGINDLGTLGGATAQMQTAFGHAIRFMISRWRASVVIEDTALTYGGAWTAETLKNDISSGGTEHFTAGVTTPTFTYTIPADYNGETIAIGLIGRSGVNGGVVTWSGTAGITGTTSTDNIMPSASLSNCPVVKRITTLTSANAGQTIIGTVTTNNGLVYIDSIWLEALEAPPVLICNIPRLTASGYSTKYATWNAAPALGSCDADVAAFNTVITNVKGEFDGMVQIADIDTVLNKVATLFVDGLHPNERGAALMVDEADNARRKFTLTGVKSAALNMNMGPRYSGGMRLRRRSGFYHTADASAITTYTPVVGDMFALPFEVTEMDEQYARWAMTVAAATSGTCTIRWGMFSDYMNKGYPDINLQELTIGTGALSISTTVGAQLNPAAQFTWWPDVANYFLVMKIETIGTGFTFGALQGPSYAMPAGGSSGDVRVASNGAAAGWKITGQATGAFPSTFPAGATPANVVPYMGALKS
jgi:hypothetical protein